jgi:hypothetical protein
MEELPKNRINSSRSFTNIGIDYCSHFYTEEKRHRNRSKLKFYMFYY